jgi:integrase/recombinase XerD
MQYLTDFATYLEATGYRPSTRQMAYSCVERFLNWWRTCLGNDEKSPLQLTSKDIELWHQFLEERPNLRRAGGLSARMIRHYLYCLRLFYNYLEQSGALESNPMSDYPLPKVKTPKRLILSPTQMRMLYRQTNLLERAMLHIYYGLGLRRSEGEQLKLKDVDLQNGILYVRKGKGDKRRAVPMSPSIKADLLEYLSNRRGDLTHDYFLINKRSNPLRGNTANKYLKRLLNKAGLSTDISLHSLRHSIASHLLLSGLSMEQVRDFLGHQYLEATQIYLHHGLEDLD